MLSTTVYIWVLERISLKTMYEVFYIETNRSRYVVSVLLSTQVLNHKSSDKDYLQKFISKVLKYETQGKMQL